MIRKFIAAFMIIFFLSSTTAFAATTINGIDSYDYLKNNELKVGDVIRSEGVGVGPKNWDHHDSFYKTFARQAARIDALRQFAEIIAEQFGELKSEYDEKTNNVTVIISQDSRAFKIIERNARVVDGGELKGGGYSVTMELILPNDWDK